jgi:hypothetical protein
MLDAFDADNTVVHQDEDGRFSSQSTDVELISLLAADRPRPVFVTGDVNQRRNPIERNALSESGLTIVFLRKGWHQQQFHVQAVKLLQIWPEIVKVVSRVKEPFAFEISAAARKVDSLLPTAKLSVK